MWNDREKEKSDDIRKRKAGGMRNIYGKGKEWWQGKKNGWK